jgi:FlaA1/EpsC-like NDP-sugar epimerase
MAADKATRMENAFRNFSITLFRMTSRLFGQLLLRHRRLVVIFLQIALILSANVTAFVLRFEGDIPPIYQMRLFQGLPFVALVYGIGLWVFGVQRGLWRYVGLHDLTRILWASVFSTLLLYAVLQAVLDWSDYPRSVIILTGLLSGGFLAGIRLTVRAIREWLQIVGPLARRVLIVGAGNAGELLVRDLQTNPSYNYRPVAFVDDDRVKRNVRIHGIPVIGTIADIITVVESYEVQEIIVAIPSAAPKVMQRILAACESVPVPIKTLPNVKQLLDSPISMRRVRPLSLEDLLQREPIHTDLQELHGLLEAKRIVVTGAGGSIGSELCRQIAQYRPALLVLFERHENSLYAIDLELRESFPHLKTLAVLGDINHSERVNELFAACSPNLIFHAAAHKHVPLMEHNAVEAVRNNVFGTRVVGRAATAAGADRFVLISTDKAVNPTSVMGATKQLAECLVREMNRQEATKFTVVRFGNVLGSNGSVVPLFTEQIRKGGPVTVTHPEIKRFFMTIPEAVQLVLQASVMGQGGDVFVLDMGEQMRVVDLARNMILLSGQRPEHDIKIRYIGLRAGEKLYEELFDDREQVEPTVHDKIKRAVGTETFCADSLTEQLMDLQKLCESGQGEDLIVEKLRTIVFHYRPAFSNAR